MASIVIRKIRDFFSNGKKQEQAATAEAAVQCALPALEDQHQQPRQATPADTVDRKQASRQITGNIDMPSRPPHIHPWPDNTVPARGPSPFARRMAREEAIRRGEQAPDLTWEEQWR